MAGSIKATQSQRHHGPHGRLLETVQLIRFLSYYIINQANAAFTV
jgi:hypothetical protein